MMLYVVVMQKSSICFIVCVLYRVHNYFSKSLTCVTYNAFCIRKVHERIPLFRSKMSKITPMFCALPYVIKEGRLETITCVTEFVLGKKY